MVGCSEWIVNGTSSSCSNSCTCNRQQQLGSHQLLLQLYYQNSWHFITYRTKCMEKAWWNFTCDVCSCKYEGCVGGLVTKPGNESTRYFIQCIKCKCGNVFQNYISISKSQQFLSQVRSRPNTVFFSLLQQYIDARLWLVWWWKLGTSISMPHESH